MAWNRGPLPPNTWNWGGVCKVGEDPSNGFEFADFQGDKVALVPSGEILKPDDVGWYDNSLELPPHCPKTASRKGAH